MDELFQGFARVGCFHEGFADEETAEAGGTQAADGFGVGDAAFGDKERGCRSVGGFAQLPGYPEGVSTSVTKEPRLRLLTPTMSTSLFI